jgi:PQQ-like domain
VNPWGEAPEAVIDLGLERDVPDPGPGPLARGDWSRFWSPAARLRWAFACCVALVLLTMAGSAPPRPPALFLVDPQPPADADGYALMDDQLFVTTGGEESALSAYDAGDGQLLWSVPVRGWVGAYPANARLLLVVTQLPQDGCCMVTAYDRADGEVRWSVRADPSDTELDGDLLAIGNSRQVLDVSSGRVLWQGSRSAVVRLRGPHNVLLVYPDGTAERRDLRTGEIQASGRIHPSDEALSSTAIVDGELIVGSSSSFEHGTIGAYDVDTLRPVWRRTSQRVDWADQCGTMLCLLEGDGLAAVDPGTGAVRWQRAEWFGVERGGYVLALTPGPNRLRAVGVVDPSTGRMLLDLDPWDVNMNDSRDTELVLTRATAGQTWVAVADLTRLTIRVVGAIPDLVTQCLAGNGHLACRDSTGAVQLWAYRR